MCVLTVENRAVTFKVGNVCNYPFKSVGHALQFYNDCNPARQRSLNLFEPDGGRSSDHPDFSGYSAKDLFASVTWAIKKSLKHECADAVSLWQMCNLGDREWQHDTEGAARKLGLDPRWAFRALTRIRDRLKEELARRELIEPPPPPVENQH